jgi:multidrug efflux pump subunit AcrB
VLLLLFVLLYSRSLRYTCVIIVTITVNLLCCIGLYVLFDLPVHIYTLAGVTVSLGILIDNALVMTDHYTRWRDHRVFPSMVFATATTIAALLMVLLLPESEKMNLTDFIRVIIINLIVSLISARIFVPSLLTL